MKLEIGTHVEGGVKSQICTQGGPQCSIYKQACANERGRVPVLSIIGKFYFNFTSIIFKQL
jgi:hypothetical protein